MSEQKSYFVSFNDTDGDVHLVSVASIQAITWLKKMGHGTICVHGRCPVRISKDEWVHLVEELAHYKAR